MAQMILPSDVVQRYNAVSGCIIANYRQQVEIFRNFSENNCLKRRLRRHFIRFTVNHLSADLMAIRQSIKRRTSWDVRCDEEETIILEKYLNDLLKMATLLDESAHLDVQGIIDNVNTAEYVMSQSVIVLLENISSVPNEFVAIDTKFLDIVYETGYAFQKFMIFTVTHLHFEDSFRRYIVLSEKVFSQLNRTLFEFRDEILVVEFVYYSKCSLDFISRYLISIMKFIENGHYSKNVMELHFIIDNYTKFHLHTISRALNSKNPIRSLLSSFSKLEDCYLTSLEEISRKVKTNWTDNPTILTQYVILFFTEIIQNIISIEEFAKGFRISDK